MKKKNKKIINNKIRDLLSNQKGMALLTTLIFVFILVTLAVALLIMTGNDTKLSALQRDSTKAFYIAEAGIEKTLYILKNDYESDQDWNTGITGHTSEPGDFDGGTYTVTLTIIDSNNVTIKSKGVVYNKSTRYVQVDATVESLSIWDNAIFAGAGASGRVINGNVDIRGSVHLLGEEGGEAIDIEVEIGGTGGFGNNYDGMDPDLRSRITDPPTTELNEETGEEGLETLHAELRVKHGDVNLSGAATVGDPDIYGNSYKETFDGVYINGDFGGNKGADNVYSDNGTEQPYDFGEGTFEFPTLDDDYINPDDGTSTPGYSYKNHYDENGLLITESVIDSTVNDFTYSDGKGNSIDWKKDIAGKGKLTISGIIVINGNFSIGNKQEDPLGYIYEYAGTGTIVSKVDIFIHGDILAEGIASFPEHNILGLIAYNDLNFATGDGDSQLKMMGAFYAEQKITSYKQNQIAGTFVSNYFDMGTNVPSIYQVPDLVNNIPPGMPGAKITYSIHTSNWHEVHD
ncbi:hypothetical protein ES702_06222 [subsurface metagenome]